MMRDERSTGAIPFPLCGGRVFAGLLLAALATPALADDKTACAEGIATIKAEIAKGPAETVLGKLRTALRVAERELGEGEFDECVDAIADAKQAVK